MAEIFYELMRKRKADQGNYPAGRLMAWVDIPSLSKSELILVFREMESVLEKEEDTYGRGNTPRSYAGPSRGTPRRPPSSWT